MGEKLTESIRRFPCLYNKVIAEYHNLSKKNSAWVEARLPIDRKREHYLVQAFFLDVVQDHIGNKLFPFKIPVIIKYCLLNGKMPS